MQEFSLDFLLHVPQGTRFQGKETKTPGPGAYNLQKRTDWLREGRSQKPPDLEEGIKEGLVSVKV